MLRVLTSYWKIKIRKYLAPQKSISDILLNFSLFDTVLICLLSVFQRVVYCQVVLFG